MLPTARAQQPCVAFAGSPHTGHKCDHLVTYPQVLIQPGTTYDQVDAATAQTTRLFGAVVPPACRQAGLRFSCLGGFLNCQQNETTGQVSYMAPCRSLCDDVVSACAAFLESLGPSSGIKLPNCSTLPSDNCNNASSDVVVPYSQADCPYPLKFNSRGSVFDPSVSLTADEQICVYPCPDPMFSATDSDAADGITVALGIISFTLIFFLIITFALNPRKRHFPTSYQLWLCVSSIICTTGIDLSVLIGGPQRTYCTWDDTPVMQSFDGARDNNGQGVICIMQGMMVMYGGLAGSFWWMMLTFTVFQFIVIKISSPQAKRTLHIASHVVGWGVPATLVTIGLAAQQFQGQFGSTNCFVATSWDWGIFYAPISVILFVGTTLMTIVIIKILRVRSQLKGQTGVSLEQVTRLCLFIVGYWLIYAYVIGYRIYLEAVKEPIQDAVADQIMCSATTGTECSLSTSINKGAWLLEVFSVGGQGIIIFLCLGMSKETYLFWVLLLRNWRTPLAVICGTTNNQTKLTSSAQGSRKESHSKTASLSEDGIDSGL